jgi:hypothetical protein
VAAPQIGAAICGSTDRGAAAGTVSRACATCVDGLLHPSRRHRAGGLRSPARWHSVVLTVRTDCGGAAPPRCHCRAARTGRRRRSQHPASRAKRGSLNLTLPIRTAALPPPSGGSVQRGLSAAMLLSCLRSAWPRRRINPVRWDTTDAQNTH